MSGATRKQRQREEAKAKVQRLVGRRIVKAAPHLFDDGGHCGTGRDAHYAHNWTLSLDDGATVYFTVEETDTGAYGVDLDIAEGR